MSLRSRVSCIKRIPPTPSTWGHFFEIELSTVMAKGAEASEPQPDVQVPGRPSTAFLEKVKRVFASTAWDSHIEADPTPEPLPRCGGGIKKVPAIDGLDAKVPDHAVEVPEFEPGHRCHLVVPTPLSEGRDNSSDVPEVQADDPSLQVGFGAYDWERKDNEVDDRLSNISADARVVKLGLVERDIECAQQLGRQSHVPEGTDDADKGNVPPATPYDLGTATLSARWPE
jgi:hypothetical protein